MHWCCKGSSLLPNNLLRQFMLVSPFMIQPCAFTYRPTLLQTPNTKRSWQWSWSSQAFSSCDFTEPTIGVIYLVQTVSIQNQPRPHLCTGTFLSCFIFSLTINQSLASWETKIHKEYESEIWSQDNILVSVGTTGGTQYYLNTSLKSLALY